MDRSAPCMTYGSPPLLRPSCRPLDLLLTWGDHGILLNAALTIPAGKVQPVALARHAAADPLRSSSQRRAPRSGRPMARQALVTKAVQVRPGSTQPPGARLCCGFVAIHSCRCARTAAPPPRGPQHPGASCQGQLAGCWVGGFCWVQPRLPAAPRHPPYPPACRPPPRVPRWPATSRAATCCRCVWCGWVSGGRVPRGVGGPPGFGGRIDAQWAGCSVRWATAGIGGQPARRSQQARLPNLVLHLAAPHLPAVPHAHCRSRWSSQAPSQ